MKQLLAGILGVITLFGVAAIANAQTIADLQLLIAQLTQQINVLEQQIIARGGSIPTSSSSAACPTITRNLVPGASGDDVKVLQRYLASDPAIYPAGTISGFYGPLTVAAVQKFQSKYGIASSGDPRTNGYGAVGPKTREAIQRICSASKPNTTTTTTSTNVPTPTPAILPTVGLCNLGTFTMQNGESRTFYNTGTVAFGATCQGTLRMCVNGALNGDVSYNFTSCTAPTTGRSCPLSNGFAITHGSTTTLYKQGTVLFGQNCSVFGQQRTCNDGTLSGDISYSFPTCSVAGAGSCIVVASSTASTTLAHLDQKVFYSAQTVPYTTSCSAVQQLRVCTDGHLSGNDVYKYDSCTVTPARSCALDNVIVAHGATRAFYSSRSVSGATNANEPLACNRTFPFTCTQTTTTVDCTSVAQDRTCTDGTLSGSATYQYSVCAPVGSRWCLLDSKYVAHGSSGTFYSRTTVPFGNSCSQFQATRSCTDGTLGGDSLYQYASCTANQAASCTLDGLTIAHGSSAPFYDARTVSGSDSCAVHQQTRTCNDGYLSGNIAFQYQSCANL